MSAYVALLLVHLHFPDAGSLKAKRTELQSVKAQLHGRHGLTVAEVDHQDVWQRATLAARAHRRVRRAAARPPSTGSSAGWRRASPSRCASSARSPRGTTWRV